MDASLHPGAEIKFLLQGNWSSLNKLSQVVYLPGINQYPHQTESLTLKKKTRKHQKMQFVAFL